MLTWLRAADRMASLISRFVDFCHIANAQSREEGSVVPIKMLTYESGWIEIGERTFINCGSSIAARAPIKIGPDCHTTCS